MPRIRVADAEWAVENVNAVGAGLSGPSSIQSSPLRGGSSAEASESAVGGCRASITDVNEWVRTEKDRVTATVVEELQREVRALKAQLRGPRLTREG